MFFWNPTYFIFALPALILAFYAQWRVQSAYNKWLRVRNARGLTGLDAAKMLLRANNLGHVGIEGTPGSLTDHYDPRTQTMRLSPDVANSNSIAAMAVVAHEIGHAVQDAQAYVPMKVRSAIVPGVQIGSWLGPILFLVGWLLAIYFNSPFGYQLAWIGVVFFAGALVFAFATLPVEFNASARAKAMLTDAGLIYSDDEMKGVRSVLDAAALTYVAAAAQALSTLLYYIFLLGGFRRRS
jgi:Zn-dependent membrane protease YugP